MTEGPDVVARRRRELGYRLRAERHRARLTQERLAIAADLDRSFYVDVENGHHSLAVDRLFAIADALGVRAGDLLTDID